MTLEQHGCEVCGSTYMQSFLKANNVGLHDPQLAESTDVEPWMGGNHVHEGPAISYTQGLSFGDGQCL